MLRFFFSFFLFALESGGKMKGPLRMKMRTIIFFVLVFSNCFLPYQADAAARREQRTAVTAAGLTYRLATEDDLPGIQRLYRELNDDDESKLVVYPEPFRSQKLVEAIEQERIFIAVDPKKRTRQSINVVSILKAFIVEDEEERQQILSEELRCISSKTHQAIPSIKGLQRIPFNYIYQFDEKPVLTEDPKIRYQYGEKQTYIYFGSAYTCPDSRGKGISTELEKYALDSLKKEALADIRARRSNRLFYIYGIVAANVESKGRIRVFSEFIQYIKAALRIPAEIDDDDNAIVVFRFFMFHSIKPTFEVKYTSRRTERLVKLPDNDENAGFGCLIDCPLPNATYRTAVESDAASASDVAE